MKPLNARDREVDAEKVLRFEALRKRLGAALVPVRRQAGAVLPSGCGPLDAETGGLQKGIVQEFCGSTGSGALLIDTLLREASRAGWYLALVDAADGFEPDQYAGPLLRRMLWVRCREARQAVRAADLLVRDGNLPLVILDLQMVQESALRKLPASTWHRYARLLEAAGNALLVLTRRPVVEGARLRFHCRAKWTLAAVDEPRGELVAAMQWQVQERSGLQLRQKECLG